MFAWNQPALVPATAGDDPSPLLTHLSGEFSPKIAQLWGSPHAVFLTAPAARRHLLCLALCEADMSPELAGQVVLGPLRKAIRSALASPPAGLERALSRMGERCWSAENYRLLIARMGDAGSAKLIRHAETITEDFIQAMTRLPSPFLANHALVRDCSPEAARIVVEVIAALVARDGEAAAGREIAKWVAAADTVGSALAMARESLFCEPPAPPFPGTERLRPLASKAQIVDAAGRFNNCLRTYLDDAAGGNAALYEWTGEPPAAVLIIKDPLFGWRLDQARWADNALIDADRRPEIIEALRNMGVHVGRSLWDLDTALSRTRNPNYRMPDEADEIADYFQ